MAYTARYLKLLSQFEIAKGTLQRIHVPGFPPVTFEMVQECHPVGYRVTAKIDGFGTQNEAREAEDPSRQRLVSRLSGADAKG